MPIVRRCWYIIVSGLVLTAALALGATKVVPAQYQAKATYVLLPSVYSAGPAGSNPYLSVGEGLDVTVGVLGQAMMSAQTQHSLQVQGATGSYTVGLNGVLPGPVILVTATDRTAAAANRTLQLVGKEMSTVLTGLQVGVGSPEKQLLSATEISEDQAVALRKTETRALLAVVAAGLAATYLAVRVVDRRKLRRAQQSQADEVAATERDPEGRDSWDWSDLLPAPGSAPHGSNGRSDEVAAPTLLPSEAFSPDAGK